MQQASLSFPIAWSSLKPMSTESVIPSKQLILCHPLLLLPSIFLSESALHIRWPKYWSFSFSMSPSNEYSGLIFFRIDWFDILYVQETLKSLPQHHSSKASFLWHSVFFMVQLSHSYITAGKTMALTRQIFVSKVMSLLVITFLTRRKVKESEVAQLCPTLCHPWIVAHQAPPSMGFSRQECWSGLPFPSPSLYQSHL